KNIALNQQDVQYLLTHYSYIELEKSVITGNQEAIRQFSTSLTQVYKNTQKLEKGSQQLQRGLEDLNTSVRTSLIPGIEAYMKGVSQNHNGLGKLEHQNQTLLQRSQQLTDGLLSFKQQTPALFGGIEQLNQGVKALYD